MLRATDGESEYRVERGRDARVEYEQRWAVCLVRPEREALREAERDDVDEDERPKSALAIVDLGSGEVQTIERVKSFALPKKAGGALAWLHEPPLDDEDGDGDEEDEEEDEEEEEEQQPTPEQQQREKRAKAKKKAREDGTELVLRDLASGEEQRFEDVLEYAFSDDGRWLALATSTVDDGGDALVLVDRSAGSVERRSAGEPEEEPEGEYKRPVFDEGSTRLAWLTNADAYADDPPRWSLYALSLEGLRLRWVDLDPEQEAIDPEQPLLLSALRESTKEAGFYLDGFEGAGWPREVVLSAHRYSTPRRAAEGDVVRFSRESYREFGDLWLAAAELGQRRVVSDANPQQAEYAWGTAELVEWTSTTGERLQGILYKPEDFDPARQYPLITYFYERSSDNLHAYSPPTPHRSIIRFSFYASRGYIVFVPDIPYRVGYPGQSAMHAVLPGVAQLVERGFVDSTAIGVQGHSWGGDRGGSSPYRSFPPRGLGSGARHLGREQFACPSTRGRSDDGSTFCCWLFCRGSRGRYRPIIPGAR